MASINKYIYYCEYDPSEVSIDTNIIDNFSNIFHGRWLLQTTTTDHERYLRRNLKYLCTDTAELIDSAIIVPPNLQT